MIFWKIYRLIRGLCPETKQSIVEAIKAIRRGDTIRAKEEAERAALRQWAKGILNE